MLATAVSMYLDLNDRVYLLRRLFFRRASQNVVSPGKRPDAPARLFLCAHYDAARTGAAFDPKRVARGARLAARLPLPIGPFRILFWSLAVLLPILGARMAGIDSGLISLLQLLPTLILLVGVFLLADIELSDVVPGANDNASGVATVLSLAEELDAEPAREPRRLGPADRRRGVPAGGHALLRPRPPRRASTARPPTSSTSTRSVTATVRFEAGEGWVVTYQLDRRLVELCDAIATADREDSDRYQARPLVHGLRRRLDAAPHRGLPGDGDHLPRTT